MEGIDELLKQAAKCGGQGGGGPSSGSPTDGQQGKDRSGKKGPDEKKDPLKDNDPSGQNKPESGQKSPTQPKGPVPPPSSEKIPPSKKDIQNVFFAKLPDKVREAVLNGDFDQVPEKYRDLIREWTKAMGKKDAEESGAPTGEDR